MSTPTAPADPRVPLAHRLTVGAWVNAVLVGVAVLLCAAAATGAYMTVHTSQVADELIERVQPARAEVLRTQAALLNQENGLRAYATSGDPDLLLPYTQGRRDQEGAERRIRTLVAGRQGALTGTERVAASARTWRTEHAEPLIARVEADGPVGSGSPALEAEREAFSLVQERLAAQHGALLATKRESLADLERARSLRDWSFASLGGLLLLTCLALAVLLHRLVLRPLRALREDTRRVSEGDFTHVIAPTGPVDLRAVGADVDEMRRRLLTALDTARAHHGQLAEQTAELDAKAVELQRSNAELEQFAYVASHDLQEPLRKVASFCQLLEKRYGTQLDERGLQYIGFAVDGAKRMQVLINDLLTFSRVGRLNETRTTQPLRESVDKALHNLAAALDDTGARVECPEDLPSITGDPTLLTMLWQNLVGNAVKFRDPQRPPVVRITAEPEPGPGPGQGEGEGARWRFCVEDNGIGIPAEFAEKVFVIFQRLHGRDAYGGTGIGLALCKKIVEHHGGRIWLDTAPAQGTRLCFTLVTDDGDGDGASVPATATLHAGA